MTVCKVGERGDTQDRHFYFFFKQGFINKGIFVSCFGRMVRDPQSDALLYLLWYLLHIMLSFLSLGLTGPSVKNIGNREIHRIRQK